MTKVPPPMSHDKHANENMSNMSGHVIIPCSMSGLKTKKLVEKSATPPFHMINMSTKTCQTWSDFGRFRDQRFMAGGRIVEIDTLHRGRDSGL